MMVTCKDKHGLCHIYLHNISIVDVLFSLLLLFSSFISVLDHQSCSIDVNLNSDAKPEILNISTVSNLEQMGFYSLPQFFTLSENSELAVK